MNRQGLAEFYAWQEIKWNAFIKHITEQHLLIFKAVWKAEENDLLHLYLMEGSWGILPYEFNKKLLSLAFL